jgi:hypothetical protein
VAEGRCSRSLKAFKKIKDEEGVVACVVEMRRADHICRKQAASKPARPFLAVEVVVRVRFRLPSRTDRKARRRNSNAKTPFDFYSPPWSAGEWADMRRKRHEKEVSTER